MGGDKSLLAVGFEAPWGISDWSCPAHSGEYGLAHSDEYGLRLLSELGKLVRLCIENPQLL